MPSLHYVEIENFKTFGTRTRIDLDHPAVLIGPNNSGKTTVLQAIALWSQAVKLVYEGTRGKMSRLIGYVELSRLAIVAVPVERLVDLFHKLSFDRDTFVISVGVGVGDEVTVVGVEFELTGRELLRVRLVSSDADFLDSEAFARVATVGVHLLYSMSGLQQSEPVLVSGYVATLMGQGRTAEVLRNLCLMVHAGAPADWQRIAEIMRRLFRHQLGVPTATGQGTIDLSYVDGEDKLALGMAGRGFLQVLLILAYLYSRKGSVLLIDEPDAHLEILRQKQIYTLMREVASETGGQVIIATHAEEIIDAAADHHLTMLIDGRVEALAKRKDIEAALKHYGANHYVKARTVGHVLYVEGMTDLAMLRALAARVAHPLAAMADDRVNVYFVEDNFPGTTSDVEQALERVEGGFGLKPREHFFALRTMLPDLRGLGLFDNDGKNRTDSAGGNLRIVHWRRYEAENYFIAPALLLEFVRTHTSDPAVVATAQTTLDALVLDRVFRGNRAPFEIYQRADAPTRQLLWETSTAQLKLSQLADDFFRALHEATSTPMLLRKGEFHRLVDLVDPATIDAEVSEKLDLLLTLLEPS